MAGTLSPGSRVRYERDTRGTFRWPVLDRAAFVARLAAGFGRNVTAGGAAIAAPLGRTLCRSTNDCNCAAVGLDVDDSPHQLIAAKPTID